MYCIHISSENFGALLIEGEHPSPFLLFHPVCQKQDYIQHDVQFYQVCCERAKRCDMFNERRPSDNCQSASMPGTAMSDTAKRRKRFIFFIVVIFYTPPFWSKSLAIIQCKRKYLYSNHYVLVHKGWFWGDPHLNTLDGRMYTFNGRGEYTLVTLGEVFELQARTEPVNMNTSATQFTACAMAAQKDGTRIEVSYVHFNNSDNNYYCEKSSMH